MARYHVQEWELAVVGIALVSAAAAFWVTVNADFLAHPGWLAFLLLLPRGPAERDEASRSFGPDYHQAGGIGQRAPVRGER
jgi:hypothetical protein